MRETPSVTELSVSDTLPVFERLSAPLKAALLAQSGGQLPVLFQPAGDRSLDGTVAAPAVESGASPAFAGSAASSLVTPVAGARQAVAELSTSIGSTTSQSASHEMRVAFNRKVDLSDATIRLAHGSSQIRLFVDRVPVDVNPIDGVLHLPEAMRPASEVTLRFINGGQLGTFSRIDSVDWPQFPCEIVSWIWRIALPPDRMTTQVTAPLDFSPSFSRASLRERLLGPMARPSSESVFFPMARSTPRTRRPAEELSQPLS